MKKIFFIGLFFLPFFSSAQLKINEIMSNNVSAVMDDSYNYSSIRDMNHIDPRDGYTGSCTNNATITAQISVKNQTDADGNYIYPSMYNMRGQMMWSGSIYDNRSNRINWGCNWKQLPLP